MTDPNVGPLIALIHGTPAAMAPAVAAFAEEFPEARLWHLLEDRLMGDADAAGGLTPELRNRMLSLIGYAFDWGADGVLLTCSMYGTVTAIARQLHGRPILGSDEAMHDAVIAQHPGRVALLASLESAVNDAATRLRQGLDAAASTNATELWNVVPAEAFPAVQSKDDAALLKALIEEATPLDGSVDMFLLCQYSLTGTYGELRDRLDSPVLSPPHMGAGRLRREIFPDSAATRVPTATADAREQT